MLGCLSLVSLSTFINGRPRGKFKASRVLRKGEFLAPFPFTLVVDVLGRLVDKAKYCGVVRVLGRNNVEVSHLQFAEDTLFYLEDNLETFRIY